MKFSRYFQDAQTPEWAKAYIDYRGLQAELGMIRAKTLSRANTPVSLGETLHQEKYDDFKGACLFQEQETFTSITSPRVSEIDPAHGTTDLSSQCQVPLSMRIVSKQKRRPDSLSLAFLPSHASGTDSNVSYKQMSLPPQTPRSPVLPCFKDLGSSVRSPLYTMLSDLPGTFHAKFFDMLDAELAKVEIFYGKNENEMRERAKLLMGQFEELGIHRQMFHESSAHSKTRICFPVLPALSSLMQWFSVSDRNTKPAASPYVGNRSRRRDEVTFSPMSLDGSTGLPYKHLDTLPSLVSFSRTNGTLNPHQYQQAKARLRKAVIEHYRGLEILNNYRMLNLTVFRKVLKKYKKITKISILDAYMKEKVEPCTFASGAMIITMLKETEHLFATRFERGNRKKALGQLRVPPLSKTYHVSTFRSGSWLGLAVPAIVAGSYLSYQEDIRNSLPWNSLLYIYSILLLPVLLALLISTNIFVWTHQRINYAFILALNPRSRLDHHEYFELPSFFLCTLAYAFWFSLAQIGSPMLWPLIWLVFTLVIMLNPFRRFMWGDARWWTIKRILKLVASGLYRVEFTDAWLGDQLCCLVYSFGGLYFMGCFYIRFPDIAFPSLQPSAHSLQEPWSKCGMAPNFGWYCLLGVSPYAIRCLQCLKQYQDSKVPTHLVNAGKYLVGIACQSCYCYWRNQGTPHAGKSYVLWFFAEVAQSIYGCAWDFLVDWSLMKPYARYPLLRPELVYKSYIPCYYFALLSNLCIRFLWIIYIYVDEVHLPLMLFIAAALEVFRRVQWNIYRLESSHIDNMKQCNITREVPLPYVFDASFKGMARGTPSWLKHQMSRLKKRTTREVSMSMTQISVV